MRCEQVFRASIQVSNRYELCRLTASITRRLHFASGNTQDAIEDAFARVGQPVPFGTTLDLSMDFPVRRISTPSAGQSQMPGE